jgi:hypothetical protein
MATEQITEQVVEQVAEHLEEAAKVTRQIDVRAVGLFLGGAGFGLAIGFFFGYRFNREKIRAEAFKESEIELDKLREVYQQKEKARQEKPSVSDLMREKGYAETVIEERPLKPPVPIMQRPIEERSYAGNPAAPFAKRTEDGEKSKDDGWDYPKELSQRSPDRPYIIHQDEFSLNDSGYQQVTYSYYAGDDVFTDEYGTVLNNVDNLIGLDNLKYWGHGADDFNVLYIRNSQIELEFEVCRTPASYEEEVLGLNNDKTD